MDRERDGQRDRWTERQIMDRQKNEQTDRQTDDREMMERQTYRWIDGWMEGVRSAAVKYSLEIV
jgi:hypothetical protein